MNAAPVTVAADSATKIKRVLHISGGKDSGGMALFAKELADRWGMEFELLFCDTGNEHPATLEYISNFSKVSGCPEITWIKADFSAQIAKRRAHIEKSEDYTEPMKKRVLDCLQPTGVPFLDLCLWKGRFPSAKARFCTTELKMLPARVQYIEPRLDAGHVVESWQGIRAEESPERAKSEKRNLEDENLYIVRPLLRWPVSKVFAMHRRHGVKPNPLYYKGMRRVGCMPCVMCCKPEMYQIASRYPEHIDRIREWESLLKQVSKRGISTFFPAKTIPGTAPDRAHIDAVASWAFTLHGGKQFSLLKQMPPPACQSEYGLCE